MKKFVVVLLTLVMLCGVISGCVEVQIDIDKPVESSSPADAQTESGETETVAEENNTTEPTITVDDATEATTEATVANNPSDDEDEGNSVEISFDSLLG